MMDVQVALSSVLRVIMLMRASNVEIGHILNFNKLTTPTEIKNFFCLLEVFGSLPLNSILQPEVYTLVEQRNMSAHSLKHVVEVLENSIEKI